MLNRAASLVALDLLGKSQRAQALYFLRAFIVSLIPVILASSTGVAWALILGGVIGYVAWAYWFRLVRSAMAHYADQV